MSQILHRKNKTIIPAYQVARIFFVPILSYSTYIKSHQANTQRKRWGKGGQLWTMGGAKKGSTVWVAECVIEHGRGRGSYEKFSCTADPQIAATRTRDELSSLLLPDYLRRQRDPFFSLVLR